NGDKMYDFAYSYRIHSTDNTNGNLRNDGAGYNARPVQVVVKDQNVSIRLKGVKIDAQKLKEDYDIPLKSDQSIYSNGNSSTTYCVKGGVKGIIDGTTFEIGEHIDLCSACITREFEIVK
ncbi:28851_t:CDS:2, partial [Racocetra persica]